MYIIIETTTDKKNIADIITTEILSKELSPCIQIVDKVNSSYVWEEKVENSIELKLYIKTIDKYVKNIVSIIKKNHDYKVPEIIATEFNILTEEYREWFNKHIKGDK